MRNLMLFIDGSVDPRTRVGFGASLAVSDLSRSLDSLKQNVNIKRFENTSSTTLELQTLLWALNEMSVLNPETKQITVYTDSQNIVTLPKRRSRLEQKNYYAADGKRLVNAEFYQEFFTLIDRFNCDFFKVKGHKVKNAKDEIDLIFGLVDRASRAALRA